MKSTRITVFAFVLLVGLVAAPGFAYFPPCSHEYCVAFPSCNCSCPGTRTSANCSTWNLTCTALSESDVLRADGVSTEASYWPQVPGDGEALDENADSALTDQDVADQDVADQDVADEVESEESPDDEIMPDGFQ